MPPFDRFVYIELEEIVSVTAAGLAALDARMDALEAIYIPPELVPAPPIATTATATNDFIEIDLNQFIDEASIPDGSAFVLTGTGITGSIAVASVQAIPETARIRLVLEAPITPAMTNLELAYTEPGTNPIRSLAGEPMASFDEFGVINATTYFGPNLITHAVTDDAGWARPFGTWTVGAETVSTSSSYARLEYRTPALQPGRTYEVQVDGWWAGDAIPLWAVVAVGNNANAQSFTGIRHPNTNSGTRQLVTRSLVFTVAGATPYLSVRLGAGGEIQAVRLREVLYPTVMPLARIGATGRVLNITEGGSWSAVIERGNASTEPFDVNWRLVGYTANPTTGARFGGTMPSGTATFGSGTTTVSIGGSTTDDATVQPTHGFYLEIFDPTVGGIASSAYVAGSLADNDVAPSVPGTITDLAVASVSGSTAEITFTPATGATSHEYRIEGGAVITFDNNAGTQTISGLASGANDIEVRGRNVAGPAAAWDLAVATVSDAPTIVTTDTITQEGVTFTFEDPADTTLYANRSTAILGPILLLSTSTNGQVLDANGQVTGTYTNGVAYAPSYRNGMMIDPGNERYAPGGLTVNNKDRQSQGLEGLAILSGAAGTAYNHAFNSSPNVKGPQNVTSGTLWQVIGIEPAPTALRPGELKNTAPVVVPALPTYRNTLSPPPSDATKTHYFTSDDFDLSFLPSFPRPASMPSEQTLLDYITLGGPYPFWTNDHVNSENFSGNPTYPPYARTAFGNHNLAAAALCLDYSDAFKRELLAAHAFAAMSIDARIDAGGFPTKGGVKGGNGGGYKWMISALVAYALRNANRYPGAAAKAATMLAKTVHAGKAPSEMPYAELIMLRTVTISHIFTPRGGGSAFVQAPYQMWMEGMRDFTGGAENLNEGGPNDDAPYRNVSFAPGLLSFVILRHLQDLWDIVGSQSAWECMKQYRDFQETVGSWGDNGVNSINGVTRDLIELLWTDEPAEVPVVESLKYFPEPARNRTTFWLVSDKALDEYAVVPTSDITITINGGAPIALTRGVFVPSVYSSPNTPYQRNGIMMTNAGWTSPVVVPDGATVLFSYAGGSGANKLRTALDHVNMAAVSPSVMTDMTPRVTNSNVALVSNATKNIMSTGPSVMPTTSRDWLLALWECRLPGQPISNDTFISSFTGASSQLRFYSPGGGNSLSLRGAAGRIQHDNFFQSQHFGQRILLGFYSYVAGSGAVNRMFLVEDDGTVHEPTSGYNATHTGTGTTPFSYSTIFAGGVHWMGKGNSTSDASPGDYSRLLVTTGNGPGPFGSRAADPTALTSRPIIQPQADWGDRGQDLMAALGLTGIPEIFVNFEPETLGGTILNVGSLLGTNMTPRLSVETNPLVLAS